MQRINLKKMTLSLLLLKQNSVYISSKHQDLLNNILSTPNYRCNYFNRTK